MASDESVYSEFTIEAGMLGNLVEQVCAALNLSDLTETSSRALASLPDYKALQQKLHQALEDNKLEALTVVGWETNERYVLDFAKLKKTFLLVSCCVQREAWPKGGRLKPST